MPCPDCFRGSVHEYAKPAGREEKLFGVRTYIAGSNHANASSSSSTILYIPDGFGFNLVNNKLLADKYASETGYRVLYPEFVPGVPLYCIDIFNALSQPVAWYNIWGQVKRAFSAVRMAFTVGSFAFRQRNIFPTILSYARSVKAGLAPGAKLGVAGFCWGGLQSTKLSLQPAVEGGKEGLINAHFTGHPSAVKEPQMFVDVLTKFDVPMSVAVGDEDSMFPREDQEKVEARLRQEFGENNGGRYEFRVYKGGSHGFAVRADVKRKQENDAAEEAALQAVNWFKKFLG